MNADDRDKDWILAMGYALGLNSGHEIPIVPEVEVFKRFFAALRASPSEAEGPHVARMENDLLAIAETVQPRAGQDSMDYAMIVSCVRRIFEADEEFYINLHAKVRGRSEEQDMSTTYIGFGNDTLAKMPTVSDGEQIICPYCQGVHKLESATTEEGKTNILMFFKCGDKSYIGAVAGRLIAGIKPDVSGKV